MMSGERLTDNLTSRTSNEPEGRGMETLGEYLVRIGDDCWTVLATMGLPKHQKVMGAPAVFQRFIGRKLDKLTSFVQEKGGRITHIGIRD